MVVTCLGRACIEMQWGGTKEQELPRSLGQDNRYNARRGVHRPDQEVLEFQSSS
jgi:hypothetical protein